MVVENDDYSFQNLNEPAMAEMTTVSSALPDPVLESAKSLLDSMSTSSVKIAKMLKPVPSPVKFNSSDLSVKPGVAQTFGYQRKNTGQKINRYGPNNWRPAVLPQYQVPDINLKTTVASNEISLTLEPIPSGNNLRKVPYYARNRTFSKFNVQPASTQIVEIDHDEMILEWHRKHVQKLLRLGPSSKPKPKSSLSNVKPGYGSKLQLHPNFNAQTAGAHAGQKRKHCEISDRFYRYLNKPKQARHDSFQVIFRSHILIDPIASVQSAADHERTLYPRKFVSWPSGKVIMPGYFPQRHFDKKNKRSCVKRKRTWSMYRVPNPRPPPVPQRVHNNKHLYSSIIKRLWNKKLAAEDRLKWDPVSRKFSVIPGLHKSSKSSNSNQWFRFPSITPRKIPVQTLNTPRKNPIQTFNISTNAQAKQISSIASLTQSNWKASFKHEPIRNSIAHPRAQHKRRDIREVFKCKVVPNPTFYESYEVYSNVSILFQIRRLVSFKAMKQGRLEKKVNDCTGADSETTKKQKPIRQVRKLSPSVLISSSTETMLSSWSVRIDKYSTAKTKTDANIANQNNAVSKHWMHVCSGNIIDSTGVAYPDHDNVDVTKEVLYAWAIDESCNDTSNATHVIDSTKRPPTSTHGSETSVLSKKEISASDNLLESPKTKMQRSENRLKCSPCTEVDMSRRSTFLPEPGYCVRYRFSFCSSDCAYSPNLAAEGNTSAYSSILPFHQDMRGQMRKLPSRDVCVESANGDASLKKETDGPDVVAEFTDSRRITGELARCAGGVNGQDSLEQYRCPANVVTVPSSCDEVVHCMSLTQERTVADPPHGTNATGVRQTRDVTETTGINDHNGHVLHSASGDLLSHRKHCLYRSCKSFISQMVKEEREIALRSNHANSKSKDRPHTKAFDTLHSTHSVTGSRHNAGRDCCVAVGGSCLDGGLSEKRDDSDATKRDSSNNASTSELADPQHNGMGNSLEKRKLLNGLGAILQNKDCSGSGRYICNASLAVVGDGNIAVDTPKKQRLLSNTGPAFEPQKLTELSESMVPDRDSDVADAVHTQVSEGHHSSNLPTVLRSFACVEPSVEDSKSDIISASLSFSGDSDLKESKSKIPILCKANGDNKAIWNGGQDGRDFPATRHGSATHFVESDPGNTPASTEKVEAGFISTEDDGTKPVDSPCSSVGMVLQNAESHKALDCDTRSSRRLRSRVNCKKRGRYETDYVSEIPKASKKPKKVYPTNDYDNEEFWRFYSRCENTVYSQNLLLQYKYINLFKSKGITSDCTPLQTQCGISTLSASNKKRPMVPKSGIMPILEKYTKQRKAPPELPKMPGNTTLISFSNNE